MAASKLNKTFENGKVLTAEELNEIIANINGNVDYINDLPTETLKGDNGSSPISCYKWFEKDATVNAPQQKVEEPADPNGGLNWKKYAPNMPSDTNKTWYLWMSLNTKNGDGTITENWSAPVRISGEDGDNGADAKDREWIYKYSLDGYDGSTGQISPSGEANGTETNKETKDDWVPNGWYDRALSVSESKPDVYASWRDYNSTTKKWGKFNPPINWSHWGSKGLDGDGVQYIYKLYPRELTSLELLSFIPIAPSSQNENKEWLPVSNSSSDMSAQDNPNTWTDDPETPTANYPFCYCSIIKQINGKWGTKNGDTFIEKKYGELSIWAKYSKDGIPGSSPINCYKWFAIGTEPSTPVNNESHPEEPDDPNDLQHPWNKYAPDRENNKHLWMSSNTKNGDGTVTESWSTPVRISGDNGDSGSDSKNREWIYNYINTFDNTKGGEVSPSGAAGDVVSKNDGLELNDWVPYGWYDRALPVSDSLKDVYTSWRDRNPNTGKWGTFNEPFVWSHWGEDGNDGDGVLYVYKLFNHELSDNELESNIPIKPDSQTDGEWIPQDWSDNPVNPIKVLPYCYCSTIKEIDNVWGNFSKLALWSTYNNSTSPINCYKWYPKSTTTVAAPQNDELNPVIPDGWSRYAPNRSSSELHLWMSQNIIDNNGDLVNEWSTPIRITGEDGDAGSDTSRVREWIYNYHNRGYQGPDGEYSPHGEAGGDDENDYITNDFVPEGWYDTALAVSLQHPDVYASWRDFSEEDEKWNDFNEPILWSHWGENGTDGDGVQYIYKLYYSELSAQDRDLATPIKDEFDEDTGEWTAENNSDDLLPNVAWSDDPLTPTSSKRYCYCSVIKKVNGEWGDFSKPSLWSVNSEAYTLVASPATLSFNPNTNKYIGADSSGNVSIKVEAFFGNKNISISTTGVDTTKAAVSMSKRLVNGRLGTPIKVPMSNSVFTETVSNTDVVNPSNPLQGEVIRYDFELLVNGKWENNSYSGGTTVALCSVPVIKNGANGAAGTAGKMFYQAGIWSSSKSYTSTAELCPIVYHSGTSKYYYLNYTGTVTGSDVPGSSTKWALVDNFGVVMTEALFADFAKLGSFIISGDFFISQYGKFYEYLQDFDHDQPSYVPQNITEYNGQPCYTYFRSADPGGTVSNTSYPKFIPSKCINALTGEEWSAEGKIHFSSTNSTIGGFTITDSQINSTGSTPNIILRKTGSATLGGFNISTLGTASLTSTLTVGNTTSQRIEIKPFVNNQNSASINFINSGGDNVLKIGFYNNSYGLIDFDKAATNTDPEKNWLHIRPNFILINSEDTDSSKETDVTIFTSTSNSYSMYSYDNVVDSKMFFTSGIEGGSITLRAYRANGNSAWPEISLYYMSAPTNWNKGNVKVMNLGMLKAMFDESTTYGTFLSQCSVLLIRNNV